MQLLPGLQLGISLYADDGSSRHIIPVSTFSADEQASLNAAPLNSYAMVGENLIGAGPQSLYVKSGDTNTIADDWEPLVRQSVMATYVSDEITNYITNNVVTPASPYTDSGLVSANTKTSIHGVVNASAAHSVKWLVRARVQDSESEPTTGAYSVFEVSGWLDWSDTTPTTGSLSVLVLGNQADIAVTFEIDITDGKIVLSVTSDEQAYFSVSNVGWIGADTDTVSYASLYE